MEPIVQTIATNLQAFRKKKGLTLQELAMKTGVSRSMLGGIEKGTTSPTITILWKIASGLKIPISSLLNEQRPDYVFVKPAQWRTLTGDDGYSIDLIFECGDRRNFEVYHLAFEPGAVYESGSHQEGVEEYTMVYEGALTIVVGGTPFVLETGDSFLFDASQPHSYRNDGAVKARAYSLISYATNE